MINIAFCKSSIIFYYHFTLNMKKKIINYLEPGEKALMIHESWFMKNSSILKWNYKIR